MTVHLLLLGGSGRIGRALVDSLISDPLPDLATVSIFCDSTKVAQMEQRYSSAIFPAVKAGGYSTLNRIEPECDPPAKQSRQVVINLRGINNKQQWLNRPLDALEVHLSCCRTLVNANLWMQRGVEIIHLSSQLCDLLESELSLEAICEGQESYRRPYMVSRLHQEMVLSAFAYRNSIPTSFVRLPAIYGFEDDLNSPWVLNALCREMRAKKVVRPRHPRRFVYLTHRNILLGCMRSLVVLPDKALDERTVKYIRPPMLRLSVESLADLVQRSPWRPSSSEIKEMGISLGGDIDLCSASIETHLELLLSTIQELLAND